MFREKIKMAMGAQNIRVVQMSKECGINASSISAFLNGSRNLRYEHIEKIVTYLGLTLVSKEKFHFHSDYMEQKEVERQQRIAERRNE